MNFIKSAFTRKGLILILSAVVAAYALYAHGYLPIETYKHRGIYMVIMLLLVGLIDVPKTKKARVFTFISITMVLAAVAYLMIFADKLIKQSGFAGPPEVIMFIILLLGLPGVIMRTAAGISVVLLIAATLLYVLYGHYIPGYFGHNAFPLTYLSTILYTDLSLGVLGSLTDTAADLLSIFLMFAALLLVTGLGDLFIALISAFSGKMTGGPAKVAVLSSAAFGMIDGSPATDVVATGTITIPIMKSVGYSPSMAAIIESLACTGAPLVPPIMGAGAFLMSDILGVPYTLICLAAIVPAFLWYFTVYTLVHFHAVKLGIRGWQPPASEFRRVIKEKAHLLLAIVALIVALAYFGNAPQGAFFGVVFLISLGV